MKKHSEMSVEDYRDRLGAVLTLVRIYTHELANHLTVVQSVCEIASLDQQTSKDCIAPHLATLKNTSKKMFELTRKLSLLEIEYWDN